MRNLFTIFVSMFIMFACTQEDSVLPVKESANKVPTLTTAEAQLKFAKILSAAASKNVEVRKFLKKEALVQFDNDYDVFYPFVKNKIVANNQTFRDILLSYCDDEQELSQIEQSQLLLNILVPDLTLFWNFNAEKWDAENKEIVVMCRDDENDTMYENGENIGKAVKGDIPGFPCLVVKNNERLMISSTNTRSGEATYKFTSDAYDGSKKVEKLMTRHSDSDIDWEVAEKLDKYIPKTSLPDYIIKAWDEFKNTPKAFQRDNIYYGMDKTSKPGVLNKNFREKIYRFRINALVFDRISTEGQDPTTGFTAEKHYASTDEIKKNIWSDGNFDIRFKIYTVSPNSTSVVEREFQINVPPRDAFSIEKIHLHHKNSTMFRQSKNFYTVESQYIKSKWIYPSTLETNGTMQILTQPWDLFSNPENIFMRIEEYDPAKEITQTLTAQSQYVNSSEISTSKDDTKVTLGYSHTTTNTVNTVTKTTEDSDFLGTLDFHFSDPIICDENKADETYRLFEVSNGSVAVTLIPTKLINTK